MTATFIGFLLVPEFSMLAFTTAIEPLRAANRLAGRELFRWRLYAERRQPVRASNGLTLLPDAGLGRGAESERDAPGGRAARLDSLAVCGGLNIERHASDALRRFLVRQAVRGTALGGISTGTYLLADAGLLDGYRCTIHWENMPGFAETFPALELTANVFEIDRDRYTCSGGTAALDMMCYLIGQAHGQALAAGVSSQFIHDRIRTPGDQQRKVEELALLRKSPKLASAIRVMAGNVERPLAARDVAGQVGISVRQLERLFRKHEGCTPQRYYLQLRLQQARRLLSQTGLPVMHVALATGFSSQSHFTKCYRECFAVTPQRERREAPAP